MKCILPSLGLWIGTALVGLSAAQAETGPVQVAPEYWPTAEEIGKPPRPGDTGSRPPRYGEDRSGSLAQDLAAVGGVVGGTVVPLTKIMVEWNETYNERSLQLDPSDREAAASLLRTHGLTSAIVTPLTSWAGFMIGGGYRQNPVRAFLGGVGAAALSYPVGAYLGGLVADPVTNLEAGVQPRFPDRTMFRAGLLWTGLVTTGTVAGVVVGGGPVVRRVRDPGYTMYWIQDGAQTIWMHGLQGRF